MWHFGGIFAPEGENRIGHGSPGHCRLALCLTQHLAPSSGCGSCIAHAGTEGQGQSTGSLSLRLSCHHRSRHHSSTWLWCFWRRMVGRLDKGAGCEGRSQEEQHSHRGEAKGSVARSRWHSVALGGTSSARATCPAFRQCKCRLYFKECWKHQRLYNVLVN